MVAIKPKYHKFTQSLPEKEKKEEVIFGARISVETKTLIDEWVKEAGLTKKQAIEFIFESFVESVPAKEVAQLNPGQEISLPTLTR